MTAVQSALLVAVIVLQLVCAVTMVVADDPFARLHLVGPVSVLGTIALTVAAILGSTSSTHAAKIIVVGLVLWVTSPFSNRAMARALRVRATGRLDARDAEIVEETPG